jgi:hypothetical protein
VGLALGFLQGGVRLLGVEGGGWSKRRERKEGSAGLGLGLLFLPSIQPDTTRGRSLARFDAGLSVDLLAKPLWSVCKKEEERRREKHGLGSSWPNFKFEFESFKLGLKVEQE